MKLCLHLFATIVPLLSCPVVVIASTIILFNTIELSSVQRQPFFIPTYATSTGGFSTAARGWNSFGLQANPSTYKKARVRFRRVPLCATMRPDGPGLGI